MTNVCYDVQWQDVSLPVFLPAWSSVEDLKKTIVDRYFPALRFTQPRPEDNMMLGTDADGDFLDNTTFTDLHTSNSRRLELTFRNPAQQPPEPVQKVPEATPLFPEPSIWDGGNDGGALDADADLDRLLDEAMTEMNKELSADDLTGLSWDAGLAAVDWDIPSKEPLRCCTDVVIDIDYESDQDSMPDLVSDSDSEEEQEEQEPAGLDDTQCLIEETVQSGRHCDIAQAVFEMLEESVRDTSLRQTKEDLEVEIELTSDQLDESEEMGAIVKEQITNCERRLENLRRTFEQHVAQACAHKARLRTKQRTLARLGTDMLVEKWKRQVQFAQTHLDVATALSEFMDEV